MKTANNAWTWIGYDISDGEPQTEKICGRFTKKEDYEEFKKIFEESFASNAEVLAKKPEEKKEEKAE